MINKDKLVALTDEEISGAELSALPGGFGAVAVAVRRAGEYPLYLAKTTALWYYEQSIAPGAEQLKNDLGLQYEREFIAMVLEEYDALPDLRLDGDNLKKYALMKKAYRLGYAYERDYRGCAQCAIAAVTETLNCENPELFRAANGFAAGMALMGDGVCGGYSGGMMSLGLFAGRRREFFGGDQPEKDKITAMGGELRGKLLSAYGTLICRGVHEAIFGRAYALTVPEEKQAFEAAGGHSLDKCTAVVGMAAARTVGILFDNGYVKGDLKGASE